MAPRKPEEPVLWRESVEQDPAWQDEKLAFDLELPAGIGATDSAEVVIARRSLISIAFDPIRQLRENMATPPDRKPDHGAASQGE